MSDKITVDADTLRNICSNLNSMIELLDPGAPVAEVSNDPTAGSPIGIVRDHPSHGEGGNSQGPSVVDRGSRQIETRWAKEAIGLTAVELNKAYAEFEITPDGTTIPSGHLHRASERLREIMQRLGITGDDLPF